MRSIVRSVAALFLVSTVLVFAGRGQKAHPQVFHSAEVLSASDVRIPDSSVASGMVELHVTIGVDGAVEDVFVARPLASVTEEAVTAVKSWKFSPATVRGKPVKSLPSICVVFGPLALTSFNVPLQSVADESQTQASGATLPSTLPEVVAATYSSDNAGRVSSGTVVLRVLVEANGHPSLVRAVRDITPMTAEALLTIKNWQFKPAQLNGNDVTSGIVLAFAFRNLVRNSD